MRPALVVLPAGELQVFPRHALVLLAGIAQEKRGMKGGNQHGVAEGMDASAELADRFLRAQQRLRRDAAERQHDLRLDDGELVGQERRTCRELIGFGIPIARRPAQNCVGDEDVGLARQIHGGQHLREQLAGATDERQPLRVFVGARALADHDELLRRVAGAEDNVSSPLTQLALTAGLQRLFLAPQRFGRRQQVFTLERQRLDTEITIEAQRLGQRAQRHGQRLVRCVAQRDALPAARLAARRRARISVRIASATALFAMRGSARVPPQRSISSTSLSSASKPMPAWLTSLATSRSIPLASSLARALAATSLVSAAKPTTNAPDRPAATSARMSGLGVSSSVRSRLPLILISEGRRTR